MWTDEMRSVAGQFERMGASLQCAVDGPDGFRLDVREQPGSETFVLSAGASARLEVRVLDLDRDERHLLLMVRDGSEAFKYLCGHDERHWFAAALPSEPGVRDVGTAMEALKPRDLRRRERRIGLSRKDGRKRRNAAWVRQGEWFFVPVPDLRVEPLHVLRNEPLRRGRGKPHVAELCWRTGGETVYVCDHYPRGLRVGEYEKLLARRPSARKWRWAVMQREPLVFVQGRVRHPDHKTIVLRGWHQVLVNTEGQAAGMRNLAFLD